MMNVQWISLFILICSMVIGSIPADDFLDTRGNGTTVAMNTSRDDETGVDLSIGQLLGQQSYAALSQDSKKSQRRFIYDNQNNHFLQFVLIVMSNEQLLMHSTY